MSETELGEKGVQQRDETNVLLRVVAGSVKIGTTVAGILLAAIFVAAFADHIRLASVGDRVNEMNGKLDAAILTLKAAEDHYREIEYRVGENEKKIKDRYTLQDANNHDYQIQGAFNRAGIKVEWPIATHAQ